MPAICKLFGRRAGGIAASGVLGMLSWTALCAQPADDAALADKQTIQILIKRIDQLEARVSELEAERLSANVNGATSSSSAPASVQVPKVLTEPRAPSSSAVQIPNRAKTPSTDHQEPESGPSESVMTDRMDLSRTLLNIRGFGDVSFHGDTLKGDTTSFTLGQLDLFVSSDISDRFRFISEIVFEGGPDNIYGSYVGTENAFSVDIERYLLQYAHNDHLSLSVGRGHAAIGYYNTAYHHSTWMQTTVDRPFLFEFEDRGGILPVHYVGASANGSIPSGSLGLHYVAELGNGRESRNPLQTEPVQNEVADTNRKAFDLALLARPTALHGFQAGFSFYRAVLVPNDRPKIGESILAAHAVLIRPKFEWLNEVLLDRHAPDNISRVFHTPGFYSQISRQFGSYRPYFRYEYLNVPSNEPVFPDLALRHGPLFGLRYDATESVALKLQYNHTFLRNQSGVEGLTAQVGFTF